MLSIKWRQYNLQYYYNYYKGALDGIVGRLTVQAYKDFQKDHNLIVDGVYGVKTNAKLIEVAKDLQTRLNNYGYNLVVDGEIGPKTISAIKDFQKKNGLVADGIAGKNTYAILNRKNVYMTDEDWKQSEYFNPTEFKCPCGKCNGYGKGIYKTLVSDMNELRKELNQPIYITSGYRCVNYNNSLSNSSKTSRHLEGRACDFYISGYTANQDNRIKIMNRLKKNINFNYTYCNINGNYPLMGNAIHYDVKG